MSVSKKRTLLSSGEDDDDDDFFARAGRENPSTVINRVVVSDWDDEEKGKSKWKITNPSVPW